MSKKIASKFLRESGADTFNGNELLVKGALETEGGVHLLTGYPGSPTATFFDVVAACADLLKEHGIEGRIANNEALAAASINGSQMGPLRAMAVVKSVGLHVASDGLSIGNLAGAHPKGGAVIVSGDDPWSETTQVPADSRFLFRHMFMPVIEPSTSQEIKDFVDLGFKLSRASNLYLGYIITSTLADGGGTVTCRPNRYPLTNMNHPYDLDSFALNLEDTLLLPPRTGRREVELPQRFERLHLAVREWNINPLEDVPEQNELVIVTSGMAYQYVVQTLRDFGLRDRVPVLKLGVTYPLDRGQIEPILSRFDHVLIAEERRSFIEDQISGIAVRFSQSDVPHVAKIWGKQFPKGVTAFPSALGLNASIMADRIARFLRAIESPLTHQAAPWIGRELKVIADTARVDVQLPARTPTFCPGCPHRDSASLLLDIKKKFLDAQYMKRQYKRKPVDVVFHGDAGCYTMLLFEPNVPLMHNYSGMGLGGGTGSGIDPFIRNKQVVFMGDGTFFHSGTLAISNSVVTRQDITYIILANGTTAMTGHQPLPAIETDLLNRPIPAQDIDKITRSIVGSDGLVMRVDPSNHKTYRHILEETILADGVKVIIADKECGITYNRRIARRERAQQKEIGYLPKKVHMNVTPEVCEQCLECANNTGCPGLKKVDTDYGPKVQTDLSWCTNDEACAKLGACPSFEQVIITRKRPPTPRGHMMELSDLPEPEVTFNGDVWRAWVAGVGGMGIGVTAGILVHAAQNEGYQVQFSDKKGLAIRNGAVYSQVVFGKMGVFVPMTLGYGKADLLIGLDLLEAVRAADSKRHFRTVASERTAVVVNTDCAPTVRSLMGLDEIDVDQLEKILRSASKPGEFYAVRISSLCERIFGTKLYANITMLGIAYQRGLIPVSLESMRVGIRKTVRADFEKNMRAFDVGRKLVCHPELFDNGQPRRSLARTVREKAAYLNMALLGKEKALRSEDAYSKGKRRLPDTKLARQYKHLVYTTLRACRELDRRTMRDIAVRIYDLVQWGGVRYARRYVQRVRRVFLTDDHRYGFKATHAVVWNLAKLMLIKDEFYVACLLTSFEKMRRDRQRYNVNPANGDRIRYRRTFHPRLFGVRVDIRVPNWSLYLLRKLRFLRKFMPLHRRQERKLLRWYEQVVDDFGYANESAYAQYVEALRVVESVTGYAEVREPKMKDAMSRANQILTALEKADPSLQAKGIA